MNNMMKEYMSSIESDLHYYILFLIIIKNAVA